VTAPARASVRMLHGLPLCDPAEIEQDTGFTRTIRSLVTIPLTSLGLLAAVAALSLGNLMAAALAVAATLGVVVSLVRDTRLSVAVDRLRTGQLAAAEAGMTTLVRPSTAPDRQRGRAEAYLAAIAWARGRHAEALRWTQARGRTLARVGAPADERYLNEASAVLLLALGGELDKAQAQLAELGPAPPGERWARAEAAAGLSVAFARDDLDAVRPRLPRWQALCRAEAPLISGWMAWALDRQQQDGPALEAAALARQEIEALALHVPALADWVTRFGDARLRYRS